MPGNAPSRIGVSQNGRLTLDGREVAQTDSRALWGRAGRNVTQSQEQDPTSSGYNPDRRYYYENGRLEGSEGGTAGQPTFGMRPEMAERLNGRVQLQQPGVGGWSEVIDPSKVEYDEEFGFLTSPDNIKGLDPSNDRYDTALTVAVSAALGGAAGLHAMGAGAAGGSAGLAATIPEDIALGGSAYGGGTALADAPAILSMEQAGLGTAGAGGLSGLGEAASNIPQAQVPGDLPLNPGSPGASPPLADMPAIQQPGGNGLLNSLGGANNLARGALGLYGLGANSRNGGGSGGSTDPASIIEQMANVNRVDHNTPLGSRRWSQGTDGRWTVNDTMDPAEEANFRNVQGLNTNVTGSARDRLAAVLAQPPRQRYDRPLGS